MEITEYLASVVRPMLKHPDSLSINKSLDSLGVLLSVTAHKEDMGMLIGKKGETAKCIRHIVRVVGMAGNARVSVKIEDPARTS